MAEKNQDVNTWTTFLANPANSKNAIALKAASVDGQKAIIKNGSDKSLYFRADMNSTTALAAFPDTAGATPVEGLHVLPGGVETYDLTKGVTQLSCFPSGGAATGLVSVKVI